jgi:Zn-dependent protease/CBS domain-containing protein
MFGRQITLFRLLGFEVKVDFSWVFLALLVTWSLAEGFFPASHPGLAPATYWSMGAAGAAGLFASIVLHELSHSVVARHYRLPIRGITLFIFGGVAQMEKEPESPKVEFLMAAAGPVASAALAAGFYGLSVVAAGAAPVSVYGTTRYLALINGLLAAFNLLPAFPLDGGRVFRSILWHLKGNLEAATRTSSRVGSAFGLGLMLLGIVEVLTGNVVGGIWWVLIGMFLRGAASASYMQMLTRSALEGEPVRRFMTADPVTVEPGVTVRELVEDYVYRYHHELFPVADEGRLLGCVSVRQVKALPREKWDWTRVRDLSEPCGEDNTVEADTDAVEVLARMNRTGTSRLMVTERGRLVGILTLKDMLALLSLKMDLEGKR